MNYPIAGATIACTTNPLTIYDQLGGSGLVHNVVLAVPGHLNGAGGRKRWASVEYVCVDPVHEGLVSSVGLHTQETDEVYIGLAGRGTLVTNGASDAFAAGTLAIAPRGTRHAISNPSQIYPLEFLVVEVEAPATPEREPALLDLFALMRPSGSFHAAFLAEKEIQPRAASVDLASYMAGPWGALWLVELPVGATVGEYLEPTCDQLLYVMDGAAHVALIASRGETAEPHGAERLIQRVFSRESGPQCAVIPAGVPRRIGNAATGLRAPVTLICLNVRRDPADEQVALAVGVEATA